jgi:hypothetical protein
MTLPIILVRKLKAFGKESWQGQAKRKLRVPTFDLLDQARRTGAAQLSESFNTHSDYE